MTQGNVRDISEILASIEALNKQADDLDREGISSVQLAQDMPRSMVAEMAERQADIVLLDDIHRKGGSDGRRAEKIKTDRNKPDRTEPEEASSDADFDQMLSALMKDLGRSQSASSSPHQAADQPVIASDGKARSENLSDLKADIDDLLSPYIDVPAARTQPLSQAPKATKEAEDSLNIRPASERPAASPETKQVRTPAPTARTGILSDVITDRMREQIAEFVLQEIKHQISGWIAQNLDKIVEDALRSLPTESRDASRTRSAG